MRRSLMGLNAWKQCLKWYLTRPAHPFKVSPFMILHKEALAFGLGVHWVVWVNLDVGVTDDHKLLGHKGLTISLVSYEPNISFSVSIIVLGFRFHVEITTTSIEIFQAELKPYNLLCASGNINWYQNQANVLLLLQLPNKYMFLNSIH